MTSMQIINGPNLNLLGGRETEVYGAATLADVGTLCRREGERLGLDIEFLQSNHEGELLGWIHDAAPRCASGELTGMVLNPGAFSHTSVALHDAIRGANVPVIEVHISNVFAREAFRHHSFVSPVAAGVIVGLGVHGYVLAIQALHELAQKDAPRGRPSSRESR